MRKLKGREESQDGPVGFLRFLENRDFVKHNYHPVKFVLVD